MGAVWDACFDITVSQEGALSLVYSDRGNWTSGIVGVGELRGTNYGISAMSYPTLDIAKLTLADAKSIYYRDFFVLPHCNMVVGPLAALMFDASVNNGPGRPAKWLQQALGVMQDGVVGPISVAAATKAYTTDPASALGSFQAIRLRFMAALPTWQTNVGWAKRLVEVPLQAMLTVPDYDT